MTSQAVKTDFLPGSIASKNLISSLSKFDLTQKQAMAYLYLSKNDPRTATEISKNLKIPRTEIYHLLNVLQSRGITNTGNGKPTKYQAVPFDKSILILINNERKRIDELEKETVKMVELWKTIL